MLPQFGLTEFLLIAVVALIVVGPRDLPLMMRKLGQFVGKARAMAKEFQSAFDDIARQAELDELRKEIEDLKNENMLKDAEREFADFERDVNAEVMRADAALKEKDSEAPETQAPDPDPSETKPGADKAEAEGKS